MRLYLIRHGETDFNKVGRMQGRLDIDMNLVGFRQAMLLHNRLANVEFDYAFSSPMKRAVDTASEILRGKDLVIYKMEELNNSDIGDRQGQLFSTFIKNYQNSHDDFSHLLAETGGESYRDIHKRFMVFLEEIEELSAKNILVVTHSAIISTAIKMALNYPIGSRLPIAFNNGGLSILDRNNRGKWIVRTINDTAHLEKF